MPKPKPSLVLTRQEIEEGYKETTHALHVVCQLSREMVGGQPATKEGVEAFVKYQMQITDEKERAEVVQRILTEELGEETDITPPEGEFKETYVAPVNVLRKTEHGVWIGDWMIKASLKQTASRLGQWVSHKGLKGDMSEAGRVFASGISLLEPEMPYRIYVRDPNGGPAKTFWQTFRGKVQSPTGPKSIVTNAECVQPGAMFEFTYHFIGDRMEMGDIRKLVFFLGNTGVGSARALERGKVVILNADYTEPAEPVVKKKTPKPTGKEEPPEGTEAAAA